MPVVLKPAHVPVPPAAPEIEVKDVLVAERDANGCARKINPGNPPIGPQPFQRSVAGLFIKGGAEAGIKPDAPGGFEAFKFLLALYQTFAFLEAGLKKELRELHLLEYERTRVLFFFPLEAIPVRRPTPDCISLADEFGRVERNGADDLLPLFQANGFTHRANHPFFFVLRLTISPPDCGAMADAFFLNFQRLLYTP